MKYVMTTEEERTAELISKYMLNSLSQTELAEFRAWIDQSPANKSKFEEFKDPDTLSKKLKAFFKELR
jgi:hypothetical protein